MTWSDVAEARQAVEVLLPLWTEVGMDDALELLGPGFEDGRVRAFAVKQLGRADDEVGTVVTGISSHRYRRAILRFGVDTRTSTQELLLYLMQLVQALKFEIQPDAPSQTLSPGPRSQSRSQRSSSAAPTKSHHKASEEDSGLADFLISRAVRNPILGTAFHWYLEVETEDRVAGKMYGRVALLFMTKLIEVSWEAEA